MESSLCCSSVVNWKCEVLREGSMAAKNLPKKPKQVLKASLVVEGEDENGGGGSDASDDSADQMNDKPISHTLLNFMTICLLFLNKIFSHIQSFVYAEIL